MIKHVYLFVFRNDSEISGNTVFLSFVLMNLIFLIKHTGKVNFPFFNRIICISCAKFKTRFSRLEHLEKCRAARYKLYLGKCLFWRYCLQLSFIYRIVSRIFLYLFCSGDKRISSDFMRKWSWFHRNDVCFP